MIKYYCDICENEITDNKVKLGALDFNRGILQLCSSCDSKFDEAKASLYDEYKTEYETLDSNYLTDLKNEILTNVNPEPIWEDNTEPTTEPVGSEE